MLTKSDIKDIVGKISKMRKYAGFRETFSKRRKELAVVADVPGRKEHNYLKNRYKCLFLAEICSH